MYQYRYKGREEAASCSTKCILKAKMIALCEFYPRSKQRSLLIHMSVSRCYSPSYQRCFGKSINQR